MKLIVLALNFVAFTGPDGQVVNVAKEHVVTVREPRGETKGHFHQSVKCLIHLDDGKFVAVTETCDVVRQLLEDEPD
jgi:hypothetical protein